ncbi:MULTISPECIES: HAD family hydrolase [unclassified Nocardiopsis]|uniref:HAD family hydrolase n=1 Tax=Nocardiopsis TaxID=2013 RepID=UPI00387B0898
MTAACPHGRSGRGAFFDVDETLLSVKSMFDFLEHRAAELRHPRSAVEEHLAGLRALAAAGTPREEVNRAHYRHHRGEHYDALVRSGLRWFESRRHRPGFWLPAPVRELRRHLDEGARVVLLSGSFFACLDPVAVALGAHEVHGTRPLTRDGVLTGEVERPMIGRAKADAARASAAAHDLCLECSHAYGDHTSDLPLLSAVGRPHVVGADPDMAAHAAEHGWPVLDPLAPAPGDPHHADTCRCGCALADWSTRTEAAL